MKCQKSVSLASLTTLRAGGNARYVLECCNVSDVIEALAFIRERSLAYMVLGEGSNVLADDEVYDDAVIHMAGGNYSFSDENGACVLRADAGVHWDEVVQAAAEKGLWGIENLAGIPGTIGAAPVQNIGAYGAEVATTIQVVRVINAITGAISDLSNEECEFGYRDSIFKRRPELIILSVTFVLGTDPAPKLSYKDLAATKDAGVALDTPLQIAAAVREIRSRKFPDLAEWGTAGSFFKNPVISQHQFDELISMHPNIPSYPDTDGVKVPLAWILDNVLHLKGYADNSVRLFEKQPLVLVANAGATASDISHFADSIAEKVFDATKIKIEREVRAMQKNIL